MLSMNCDSKCKRLGLKKNMRMINHLNMQATKKQPSGNNLYKGGHVPQTQDINNLIKKKLYVGNKIIVLFKILTHFPRR